MSTTTHLLWVDLETTGTDEHRDEILEVGWILTDPNLVAIDRGEAILPLSGRGMERLMANDFVWKMYADNGLLEAMARAYPESIISWGQRRATAVAEFQKEMDGVLHTHGIRDHEVMIAGSGAAHFDRRFIKAQLPGLDSRLSCPALDVGAIRRAIGFWYPGACPNLDDGKPHRAAADVSIHLREARYYRAVFNRLPTFLGEIKHHVYVDRVEV